MSDGIGFDIDVSQFNAAVKALAAKTPKARIKSALQIGLEIMRLSQMEVPHDKGSLQNSGTVQQVGDDVIVGYHTPYAARLHEHPEYKFQKGRKGKYLSDPIVRNAPILGLKFTEAFKDAIS